MSDLDKTIKYLRYRFDTILSFLSALSSITALDSKLYSFFKQNKKFGSSDRSFISECLFFYIRHKTYIDTYSTLLGSKDPYCCLFLSFILSSTHPRLILDKMIEDPSLFSCLEVSTIEALIDKFEDIVSFKFGDTKLNLPTTRYSLPEWLVEKIRSSYPTYWQDLCKTLLSRSPTSIRVNTNLISKKELLSLFKEKQISYHLLDLGIALDSKVHIDSLPEYKSGLFEIQDEASQLICSKMDLRRYYKVVDYCAGAGGKSLNLAASFPNTQFYCYDIRSRALEELKKRSKRASCSNIHPIFDKSFLPHSPECLLLDVPCSGLGTLRRSPWIKWALEEKELQTITDTQFQIVTESIELLRPTDRIYYVTCSILQEENENQTHRILDKYNNLELVQELSTNPYLNPNTDGMYMAEFKVKS